MNITIVGKKGCTKCDKMAMILKNKGHSISLVYPENAGKRNINGIEVNLTEEMHYPIYIVNSQVVESFKDLNQMIATPMPAPIPITYINPRLEDP